MAREGVGKDRSGTGLAGNERGLDSGEAGQSEGPSGGRHSQSPLPLPDRGDVHLPWSTQWQVQGDMQGPGPLYRDGTGQ